MKNILLLFAQIFFVTNLFSQNFIEVQNVFPTVRYPHIQSLDFDNDDDLDICVWGIFDLSTNYRSLVVYRNQGNNQFDPINADSFISYGSTIGHINVADINKDNIPEIVSTGNNYKTKFIQYSDTSFFQLSGNDIDNIHSPSYQGMYFSDFDQDGADEIIDGGNFYESYKKRYNFHFENVYNEWTLPVDVNNDGRTDIFRVHRTQYDELSSSFIYVNNGSSFDMKMYGYTEKPRLLEAGDYNNDGYEDLIIFSYKDRYASQPTAKLYRNDNGNLVYVKDIAKATSGRFVDVDNDGDLDLALMGFFDVWDQCYLKFYQNNGNDEFLPMQNDSIQTDFDGDICVGDFDNDGDNDLLISNYGYSKRILKLCKNLYVENNPGRANTVPSAPMQLKSEVSFNSIKLSWGVSTDNLTPSASVSYNVYVKKSDGTFITSPIANIHNGYRKIGRKGNAGFKSFYEIKCLEDGKYYWSVQAIDNSNIGSEFAPVDSFEVRGTTPAPPTELTAKTISDNIIQLKWKDNSVNEDGFYIESYIENNQYGPAGFYRSTVFNANITECDIDNLQPDTKYIFRVRAFNCSTSSSPSNAVNTFTYPPQFTKKILLDRYYGREAEWGDFDNDGDLDILMFYNKTDAYGNSYTRIIENKTDTLTELEVGLPVTEDSGGVNNGSANWFDYNNDGLLDILLIQGHAFSANKMIFRNNGDKTFTNIKCDNKLNIVPGSCGPSFADFDNDGDMDILLMGTDYSTYPVQNRIKIYENLSNGKFADRGIATFSGVIKSRMPWADFNNDGYLDFLVNEIQNGTSRIVIYKNNGNKTFTKINYTNLQGLNSDVLNQAGDMRWGDFNNDGFADILISGAHTGSNGSGITRIYKNNRDGTFTDSGISNIYGMAHDVSIEWGDYNNDGVLDILQTGDGWINGVNGKTRIFFNKNGSFEKESKDSFLEDHQHGMSTAADYDNDGDLDILVLGQVNYTHHQVALYENYQFLPNDKPGIPSGLGVEVNNNVVTLKWDRSVDSQTPASGLSYNVYLIGNKDTIIAPNALQTGKRTLVGTGNAQQNNFIKLKDLAPGTYRWSVQSIDNCFEASSFAQENTFELNNTTNIIKYLNSGFSISPNPFSNLMRVEYSSFNKNSCNIQICDLSGKKLIYIKNVSLPYDIDTSSLASGLYILKIFQENLIFTMKVVKN